ncbi:MAG: hypothetical protein IJL77_05655 [Clostridia bacterium]|nr:hypothetical protein [Clostridia bacterium]
MAENKAGLNAAKYDKFNYIVGSKSEIVTFSVGAVLLLVSFIPVLAAFPRDILRLFCAVLCSYPIIIDAFYGIKKKKIVKSLLLIITIVAAMFIGRFLQAAAVSVLFRVYDFLDDALRKKCEIKISSFERAVAENGHLVRDDGGFEFIESDKILPEMQLAVLSNEILPVDALIADGESSFDYSLITGEMMPRKLSSGDKVYSGAVNKGCTVYYTAVSPQADSLASRINKALKSSAEKKTVAEKKISRFSAVFTFAGVAAALLVALTGSLVTKDPLDWVHRGLVILAASCPSVLLLGAFCSVKSSLSAGASKGIVFSDPDALFLSGSCKSVCVNDSEILMTDKVVTGSIYACDGYTESDILNFAALCLKKRESDEAKAVKASAGSIDYSAITEAYEKDGAYFAVTPSGILSFARRGREENQDGSEAELPDYPFSVALDGKVIGCIDFVREIKKSTVRAVELLRSLGISDVYSPGIKTGIISDKPSETHRAEKNIKRDKKACISCGDFANADKDDVTICAGPDEAGKTKASVFIIAKDLMKAADMFILSDKMKKAFTACIVFALLAKVTVMILGLLGIVQVWLSGCADIAALIVCFICRLSLIKRN